MLWGEGAQECQHQQFKTLSGDKFQHVDKFMNNSIYIIGYYQNYFLYNFFFDSICDNFLRGGGHFAEMPTVAGGREVGVINCENLTTSLMDGFYSI